MKRKAIADDLERSLGDYLRYYSYFNDYRMIGMTQDAGRILEREMKRVIKAFDRAIAELRK